MCAVHRKQWEDLSGKMGASFDIEAAVGRNFDALLRQAKSRWDLLFAKPAAAPHNSSKGGGKGGKQLQTPAAPKSENNKRHLDAIVLLLLSCALPVLVTVLFCFCTGKNPGGQKAEREREGSQRKEVLQLRPIWALQTGQWHLCVRAAKVHGMCIFTLLPGLYAEEDNCPVVTGRGRPLQPRRILCAMRSGKPVSHPMW